MMFISHRLLQPAEVEGEEKRMGTGEIGKLIPTYVRQTAPTPVLADSSIVGVAANNNHMGQERFH